MADATVVITTRNRVGDLRKAITSAINQSARPQVLVMDDGSTDGTAEMIAREFPFVGLHRSAQSQGYIKQRNLAARLSTSPFLFSIDDDAAFSSPTTVERTLLEFNNARIGAVAIPFVDVNRSPELKQQAPDETNIYAIYTYIGTAHALRKDLFLGLGGYRELLIHQGEEEDYCTRMLQAGYITRCGSSNPIFHFESPRRSWDRMDYYGARNKVLYAWHNVPGAYVGSHIAATTVKTLLYNLRPGRFWTRLKGVVNAYHLILSGTAARQPVAPQAYRLSRRLKSEGAVLLDEIERELSHLTLRHKDNAPILKLAEPSRAVR